MNKLFLTIALAFSTMIASAQYQVMTTITSTEDEAGETTYNVTDKIGVGYQVSEKLMVGLTTDGEDKYELLGRYSLMNGIWLVSGCGKTETVTMVYQFYLTTVELILKLLLKI